MKNNIFQTISWRTNLSNFHLLKAVQLWQNITSTKTWESVGYLPAIGFAAAITEHRAWREVTIPAFDMLILCCSIASCILTLQWNIKFYQDGETYRRQFFILFMYTNYLTCPDHSFYQTHLSNRPLYRLGRGLHLQVSILL